MSEVPRYEPTDDDRATTEVPKYEPADAGRAALNMHAQRQRVKPFVRRFDRPLQTEGCRACSTQGASAATHGAASCTALQRSRAWRWRPRHDRSS